MEWLLKTPFAKWLHKFINYGIERATGRFYSIYKAEVVDNVDPTKTGRITVRCPAVGTDDELNWAIPSMPFTGAGYGCYFPPEIGEFVWVEFLDGNINYPIYRGGWWIEGEITENFVNNDGTIRGRGIKTKGGHTLVFVDGQDDDDDGQIEITHKSGSFVVLDKNGSIIVSNKNGTIVYLNSKEKEFSIIDENSNTVSFTSKGIAVIGKSGDFVKLENGKINIVANSSVLVQASGTVQLEGGKIQLGGPVGLPAARVGDAVVGGITGMVSVVCPPGGGPAVGQIISGSIVAGKIAKGSMKSFIE